MDGYDYGNTRFRARLADLLGMDQLASFCDISTIDGFITMLTKTPHRESIEYALTFSHGYACVAQALQRELDVTRQDLLRFYSGPAAEKINLFFLRNDLKNIKAILRGLSHRNPFDEITASFNTLGTIPAAVLMQIAKSGSVDEAISKMAVFRIPIAQPLLELKGEQAEPGTAEMENRVELWYFRHMTELVDGRGEDLQLLKEYNAMEADIVNLNTVLRFVSAPLAEEKLPGRVEDYLIPYGNVSPARWRLLAGSTTPQEVVKDLSHTRYKKDLRVGLDCYQNTGNLSEFEANMRTHLLRWLARLPRRFPLGIGVPLGFIARKLNEIRNLRWIAQGIISGFEPAFIRENLESAA
jgi:vacuolar-type H+-ATPase subunit C/Vma6